MHHNNTLYPISTPYTQSQEEKIRSSPLNNTCPVRSSAIIQPTDHISTINTLQQNYSDKETLLHYTTFTVIFHPTQNNLRSTVPTRCYITCHLFIHRSSQTKIQYLKRRNELKMSTANFIITPTRKSQSSLTAMLLSFKS